MIRNVSPLAGKLPPSEILVNVPRLIAAYYSEIPDYSITEQRVIFGTSGHRGSSFKKTFNESHVLAITQAVCLYRVQKNITGPLFMGMDTHALSQPALETALEVLTANNIDVMIAVNDEYTPTPAISHAILMYNRGREEGLADGIVMTPSHNPPHDGGFKYNTPNGSPADSGTTTWIENKANELLKNNLRDIKKTPLEQALRAPTTHRFDYRNNYVNRLGNIIDMDAIRSPNIRMGVDPLGGAGVHYWTSIAERYKLNLTVVNKTVDSTFKFMTADWDGQLRMDPSSPYAMESLIKLKDQFDIAFACDPDHDRHGIVTPSIGLMQPNHYLSAAIFYLFQHRPQWSQSLAIGKTLVSSQMIDRITARLGRKLYEVPVGFKWFVDGLVGGSLGFAGEESAGASFVSLDGSVWSTDKDGITAALLSAEITTRMNRDPAEIYHELEYELGESVYTRIDALATSIQRKLLGKISSEQIKRAELAGDKIQHILTHAPGNGAPIGGLKVMTENGWFAARPSGTEDIYKIYAESFCGKSHLDQILSEAQCIVNQVIEKEDIT